MPIRICIAGYYGVRNTGDDLLLQSIWELWPDAEIRVLCKDSLALMQELPMASEAKDFAQVSGWQGAGGLRDPVSGGARRILDSTDLLIVGGGGLLGNGNVFAAPEVFYAHEIGVPVMLMGVGVNPFSPSDVSRLRPYFEAVDAITTRDHWSWHNLRPFHESTRCFPSTCPVNGTRIRTTTLDVVPIVLSHSLRWARGDGAKIRRLSLQINAITSSLQDLGLTYKFLAFSPRQKGVNDVELFNEFKPELNSEAELIVPKDVGHVVDLIRTAPYVIGDRFHSLVLACRYRIPFVGMVMDSKQREISMEAGMPWFYPHKDNEKRASHSVYLMVEKQKLPPVFPSPTYHKSVAEEILK